MRVHFIAIGGSAMHNLAIALHKKGFQVTGSDDVIYEPAKSRLAKYGILPAEMGWNAERIDTAIEVVILGMHARIDNPELLKAQELGLKIYSYPEFIYEQSKDKKRVVIGGSHGKTTITSMILHVLNYHHIPFDYLVGAQLEGFDTMVQLSEAPLIVIEGDEYLASPIDRRPKFHLYHAHTAVLSGIAWDHINVFPTFENYVEQFEIFVNTIESQGKLIYCAEDEVLKDMINKMTINHLKLEPYSIPDHEIKEGVTHLLPSHVALQVFGAHNLLNLNAAALVCADLGIDTNDFLKAIQSFKGAAKRLERLATAPGTNVYKDFAHSPSKLKASIHAVKAQFASRRLISCMELHTFSSLNKDFLKEYAGCMDESDLAIVYIDFKTFELKKMEPFTVKEVQEAFGNKDLLFFDDAQKLEAYLNALNYGDSNLLLMSSGNFGGMDLQQLAARITQ